MVRLLLVSIFVLLVQQTSQAEEIAFSQREVLRQYSPTVIRQFRHSPYYYQYGFTAVGWQAYLNSQAHVLNAEARQTDAETRQIDEVTRGLSLENKRLEIEVRRDVKQFQYDAKQQRRAEYFVKAQSRREAYERLKQRRAMKEAMVQMVPAEEF